jgi:hypothetical protein
MECGVEHCIYSMKSLVVRHLAAVTLHWSDIPSPLSVDECFVTDNIYRVSRRIKRFRYHQGF